MQRQLTLATNSLKRIIKDVDMSYKERDEEVARLEKMKTTTDDHFRLNQQETVVAQAVASISDYKQMLAKAMEKLRTVLKEAEQDVTIESKDIDLAREMLEKAKAALETEK